MAEETLQRRKNLAPRRQTLEPGESTGWHTDPCHRFSVVVRGSMLAIEYADTGEVKRLAVSPGESGWDEPTDRVHRATNLGSEVYEEVALFVLAEPNAEPQPHAEPAESS